MSYKLSEDDINKIMEMSMRIQINKHSVKICDHKKKILEIEQKLDELRKKR